MTTLKAIRKFVMTLPEVEEGPPVKAARRIAAFKVAGKSFLGIETGETTITVSLNEEQARAFTGEHPDACEEIWRNGTTFMGLRVNLSKVPASIVRELIQKSWLHSAPKRITQQYQGQNRR